MWFRYPTRKNEWVFKGLDLKIKPNESVAMVGESGSGKSTMVGLLLRYYDPDFGQVLIDGVDIKKYDLHQLRKKMGLVQQEPILFNYTIEENILYGNDVATNSEIRDSASIANALEFIETNEQSTLFDDDARVLLQAWVDYKRLLLQEMTEEQYDLKNEHLKNQVVKE